MLISWEETRSACSDFLYLKDTAESELINSTVNYLTQKKISNYNVLVIFQILQKLVHKSPPSSPKGGGGGHFQLCCL